MAEPLTLEQAKAHLRILDNSEDDVIASAIEDARGWIENYTGLILTQREIVEVVSGFGEALRAWPVAAITSVGYVDGSNQAATLAPTAYFAQIGQRPARMTAVNWPAIYSGSKVRVTMQAGFETPDAVKAFSPNIMRAMRILVAGYYNDRETGGLSGDVETAAQRLCRNLKRWSV